MRVFFGADGEGTNDSVVWSSLWNQLRGFALLMSPRFFPLLLGLLLTLSPAGTAQVSGGVAAAYHELQNVNRWGVSGAVYIPVAGHAFDIVPNFEYYPSAWSTGADDAANDTSGVYAVSADVHVNLPALADRLRAYIGTGVTFAGHGSDNAFGLNVLSGVHVRAHGWKVFPYGQVTYRVLPDFTNLTTPDTYFFRGGVRVVF